MDLLSFVRSYSDIGGWSLFVGLCLFIVAGSFREAWVSGKAYRRALEAAEKLQRSLDAAMAQNTLLLEDGRLSDMLLKERLPTPKGD